MLTPKRVAVSVGLRFIGHIPVYRLKDAAGQRQGPAQGPTPATQVFLYK